ncbi:MAG: AAA family ATPase [Planctomycetia bacterium]|nr:AAA family ATPase [Planctomycetia bacterium]
MSEATPLPLPARACSEIAPASIQWLWKPWLARGKLSILDGDPGTGKSFFTIDLAARISRAGPLPDGQLLERPLSTLLMSAEDDAADTIRPRAGAAGADLARVIVAASPGTSDPLPQFPDCIPELSRIIYEHGAELLVIDPMMSFFPPRVCTNSDQRVRQALGPLTALASETGCAILLVRHLSKTSGPSAVYRGSGSIGIVGAARTGLLLSRHPDDPDLRVLAMTKTNVGPLARSLGFRLSTSETGPALQWVGRVDLTADELCGSSASQEIARRPRERAAEFLRLELANGPRAVVELEQLAAERGIGWRTIVRAKEELTIKSEQRHEGGLPVWYWRDTSVKLINTRDLAPLPELEPLPGEWGRINHLMKVERSRPPANPFDD